MTRRRTSRTATSADRAGGRGNRVPVAVCRIVAVPVRLRMGLCLAPGLISSALRAVGAPTSYCRSIRPGTVRHR